MRFREEVLAKIFTYITVAVLLGIVAFEAGGFRESEASRKDARINAPVLQEESREHAGYQQHPEKRKRRAFCISQQMECIRFFFDQQ